MGEADRREPMGPEQQGPRSGAETSWNTGMWVGPSSSQPAPPGSGRETPQHGVNRGETSLALRGGGAAGPAASAAMGQGGCEACPHA